jgi:hypothetical protein
MSLSLSWLFICIRTVQVQNSVKTWLGLDVKLRMIGDALDL